MTLNLLLYGFNTYMLKKWTESYMTNLRLFKMIFKAFPCIKSSNWGINSIVCMPQHNNLN